MDNQNKTDVIIVETRLASLTTARKLKKTSYSVKVLEARDRVGGRNVAHHLEDGNVLEMGGQWIGPTQYKRKIYFLFLLLVVISCKQAPPKDEPLSEKNFTPIEKIDPQVFFATEENKAIDPNNVLMEMFRKKKAADLANPEKPRPFSKEELSPIENITHEQEWTPIQEVFKFNWNELPSDLANDWSKVIKTRVVFDSPDFKVAELAIAPGAVLPLHAQPTPSCYHILGGTGEVMSGEEMAKVYSGTTINFDSYTKKSVKVTSAEPLKILWFSWAPDGDQSYLNSGYYLTGSNVHIQPIQSVLPEKFNYWDKAVGKLYESITHKSITSKNEVPYIGTQKAAYQNIEKQEFYPNTPSYRSAVEEDWVKLIDMDPKSFFFAKDIVKLGDALKTLSRIGKIKSVFRVQRPEKGYDLNYSYVAWGPQSKYITHSHAICEFYYILEGDVEYIINDETYHGVPGNFYFHPPYYNHEVRGLTAGVPLMIITGSWIPFGKRELFEQPFFLLEEMKETESAFPSDFDFHDFNLNRKLKYGVI